MMAGNMTQGFELWQYDGSSAFEFYDFAPDGEGLSGAGGFPTRFIEYNGYLFTGAYYEGNGHQLFLVDSNENTIPVIDVNADDNSADPDYTLPFAAFDNDFIFANMLGANIDYWRLSINGF